MNDVDDGGESAVVASPTAAAAVVKDAIWYKEPAKYLRQPVKSDSLTFEGENWKFMLAWAVSRCASGFRRHDRYARSTGHRVLRRS